MMKILRHFIFTAIAALLAGNNALAQTANTPTSTVTNATPTPTDDEADDNAWSFSASATKYFIPNGQNYVQPTIIADRNKLHLEARYNYENINTTSTWIGYNFSGGEDLTWGFTPMLGGVFGDTRGIAPGYEATLAWGMLQFYSEGEHVFDKNDSSNSYYYSWSELTLSPVDWLRFGMVTQRTRVYQTDRDVQRGVLVNFSFKNVNLTGYIFNPDQDKPTYAFAVGLAF